MSILSSILTCLLLFLINLSGSSTLRHLQSSSLRQSTCNYSSQACGNLSIPYAFAISDGCGLPQYRIVCKRNASYGRGDLPFLQIGTSSTPELQVLRIGTNELSVNSTQLKAMPSQEHCTLDQKANASFELRRGGPFILSDKNWFAVIGCSSIGSCRTATIKHSRNRSEEEIPISCQTSCYNQYVMRFCNTYTCCVNPLPPHSWNMTFDGTGLCGFSTVLDPTSFELPSNEYGYFAAGHYGISISWALLLLDDEQNCSSISERTDFACHAKATCIYDEWLHVYTCNCTKGYQGDGYKAGNGCQDINECEEKLDDCEGPPNGKCTNIEGSFTCNCTAGGVGSGRHGTCPSIDQTGNVLVPALIGALIGAAILAAILVFVCTVCITYRKRKMRRDNFHRAGGDQLTSYLFSERALSIATNSFSKSHVIGEGGFGEVYWGKLSSRHGKAKVAIKRAKPKAVDEQMAQMQSFVREIMLLSKTVHKNVVKLIGCCVETSVPLLVYEYVEKGNLMEYLKPGGKYFGFLPTSRHSSLWAWRLHVAVDTAEALSYLHDKQEPIFHLDLKPSNILIDKSYNPKVADFGLSCFLPSDATHLNNPLTAFTPGYVDLEYGKNYQITNKYDVYSFGVILLELISAWPPFGPAGALSHQFCLGVNMKEEMMKHSDHLESFIDSRLEYDAEVLSSINEVADIARRCVAMQASHRPSMQKVHRQLKQVQANLTCCKQKLNNSGSRHGITAKNRFPSAPSQAYKIDDSLWVPQVSAEDSSDGLTASTKSLFSTRDKQANDTLPDYQAELVELQPVHHID